MRKTMVSVTMAVLVWLGLVLATPASAVPNKDIALTTPTHATTANDIGPMSAVGCNGNVCMFLSTPSNGTVYIQAWARNTNFYGNFDLTGPNGLYRHGGTQWWYAGSHPNVEQWSGIPAVVGQYCVLGWESGNLIGRPCARIL